MKTVIVNIPESKEKLVTSFLKKNRIKSRVVSEEDLEDELLARWIEEGMKSEDIPIEKVFELLKSERMIC